LGSHLAVVLPEPIKEGFCSLAKHALDRSYIPRIRFLNYRQGLTESRPVAVRQALEDTRRGGSDRGLNEPVTVHSHQKLASPR
jgi:hypothetical protein